MRFKDLNDYALKRVGLRGGSALSEQRKLVVIYRQSTMITKVMAIQF